jgi:hypothetical protein
LTSAFLLSMVTWQGVLISSNCKCDCLIWQADMNCLIIFSTALFFDIESSPFFLQESNIC